MNSLLLSIALSLFANTAMASELIFTTNTKSKAVQEALEELKTEIPSSLKDKIPSNIEITFTNLNGKTITSLNEKCSDKIILSRDSRALNRNKIEIDNVFNNELGRGDRAINCAHKSIKTYFKATIAHELAHAFDVGENKSKSPLFLNITGWINKGLIIKRRTNLNQRLERSPNPFEFKNSQETFAVNFEHFLFDPNFKCRRPTYYDFYSKTFNTKPHAEYNCTINNKVVVTASSTSGNDDASSLVKNLDLSRLYQVHYLFAGKGEQAMSRFGHAMYRLVMCAPGHAVGPQCMNDVGSHIVISFRANIQDINMDYAKGLNGEYPSQMFLLPLSDVVKEYTKGEFREVSSLPIKLNSEQKKLFLQRTLELFWSYRGKYYFFTNNCATEAMNLLRIALGETDDAQTKHIVTPIGLFDYLVKTKLGDSSVLANQKEAQLKGFYFPGITQKITDSMKKLNITESDFQKFAANYDAKARMQIYKKALDSNTNKILIAANALRLEDLIIFSEEMGFAKELGAKLFGNDPDPRLKETVIGQRILELQKLYTELDAANFLAAGYGIPLQNEFESISQDKFDEVKEKVNDYTEDLKNITSEFFPEKLEELANTMLNRQFLLNVIKGE